MSRLAHCLLAFSLFSPPIVAQWTADDGKEHEVLPGKGRLLQSAEDQLRFTLSRLDQVDWENWKTLQALLLDVHTRTGIPALAAAYVADGKIVDHATVGVEVFGSERRVARGAPFHLGSLTKSITATLIGKLIEEGMLGWDTRIAEVLDDVEMHAGYRDVTVEQLLQHRGGLHAHTGAAPAGFPDLGPPTGTPVEVRATFLAATLALPPAAVPGEATLYSNAGYTVVGAMAERVCGASWEELVARYVFEPLRLATAGFGVPAAPSGHAGNGPRFDAVPLAAYPPTVRVAPAGNIHASIEDLAVYALAHLRGLGGEDGLLRAATFRRLHTPLDVAGGFASGWALDRAPSGEPLHRHAGTTGAYYADAQLSPARGAGIVFLTSVGPSLGEALSAQVARAIRARFEPSVSGPAGFEAVEPRAGRIEITELDSSALDDDRFWRVVDAVCEAINDENRDAYSALFHPDYSAESRNSLFDFFMEQVLPSRGGIHAFHEPGKPFLLTDASRPMRVVTFHLENGFPGTIGIELDDQDRLLQLSLFVKSDLCPNGCDRRCKKIRRRLGEER